MRLAIFYPVKVFYNGDGKYTGQTNQFNQFIPLKQYFDEIDIVVFFKETLSDDLPNEIDLNGYNIQSLPYIRSGYEMYTTKLPQILFALVKLFLKHRHEWDAVLIFECFLPNQFAYLLCKIFRKPLVLFVDGRLDLFMWYKFKRERLLKKSMGWLLCKYFELVSKLMIKHATTVVDSKEIVDLFHGKHKELYVTVSTTISSGDIKNEEQIKESYNKDTLNALTVCRIHPQKGLEYLIEAIGKARESGVNVKLSIVGPSDVAGYERLLKEKVSQTGLSELISFIGPISGRKELMKFYEDADVLVLSSLNEGSPKVIPEAMSRGLPVISTGVGSIPDLIQDGLEGILVGRKDADGLSEALVRIGKDTDLRHRMSKAALTKSAQFTLDVQLERFANIIKGVAHKTKTV